jgi:hypothetical protein
MWCATTLANYYFIFQFQKIEEKEKKHYGKEIQEILEYSKNILKNCSIYLSYSTYCPEKRYKIGLPLSTVSTAKFG